MRKASSGDSVLIHIHNSTAACFTHVSCRSGRGLGLRCMFIPVSHPTKELLSGIPCLGHPVWDTLGLGHPASAGLAGSGASYLLQALLMMRIQFVLEYYHVPLPCDCLGILASLSSPLSDGGPPAQMTYPLVSCDWLRGS